MSHCIKKTRTFNHELIKSNFLETLDLTTLGQKSIAWTTDIENYLPKKYEFYVYNGSWTFPGCNENVTYVVIDYTFVVKNDIIDKINDLYLNNKTFISDTGHGNNRKLQRWNKRIVKKGGSNCNNDFIYILGFVLVYATILIFIFKML